MNWEKEIIRIIRADEYDHEDVEHNDTTLQVCNYIRENFDPPGLKRDVDYDIIIVGAEQCSCGDKSTGWTEIKCCNICGLPTEKFWIHGAIDSRKSG